MQRERWILLIYRLKYEMPVKVTFEGPILLIELWCGLFLKAELVLRGSARKTPTIALGQPGGAVM